MTFAQILLKTSVNNNNSIQNDLTWTITLQMHKPHIYIFLLFKAIYDCYVAEIKSQHKYS